MHVQCHGNLERRHENGISLAGAISRQHGQTKSIGCLYSIYHGDGTAWRSLRTTTVTHGSLPIGYMHLPLQQQTGVQAGAGQPSAASGIAIELYGNLHTPSFSRSSLFMNTDKWWFMAHTQRHSHLYCPTSRARAVPQPAPGPAVASAAATRAAVANACQRSRLDRSAIFISMMQ